MILHEIIISVNLLEFNKSELEILKQSLVRQQRWDAAGKIRSMQQTNQAIEEELNVIIK